MIGRQNSAKYAIFGVIFLVLPFLATAQTQYALVIGNGAYSSIAKLNNPVNDATDMKAALEGLGFQVDLVTNGDRVQMEEAVTRLKNRLSVSKDAHGFFFYAGHGVQSQGENYLLPVDANIPNAAYLRDRTMNVQIILDELNDAGNELNVIVLDACRDNPFSWNRSGSRGLSVVGKQPAGSIIVYATSAGSVAADGQGRNGLFTTHLLNNLKTPGLEVKDIFNRTGSDVRRASNSGQIPAIYSQFFETAYWGRKEEKGGITVLPGAPPQRPVPEGFVRIEGGTFTMGSPSSEAERFSDEGPQHTVSISAFYMGKYEVTQKEWVAVMGSNPSYFKGDNLPVEQVSWYDAIEYCNKRSEKEGLRPAYTIDKSRLDPNNYASTTGEDDWQSDNIRWIVTVNKNANGYRLPTEAEWEYACRAATTTPFSTGNNITTNQANYNGDYGETTAVGSFAPNRWGLYDMHGNVWEWCWDWYESYSTAAQTDPTGASSGPYRVLRGGGWSGDAQGLRSAGRNGSTPSFRFNFIGFRVVRP
ncbi:hypothetical protein AGMMS50268_09820 [Spirochaetia bacterium]|nr:hypothetical protein AGMMS50268_09820 [Spirochaetia bacterium]